LEFLKRSTETPKMDVQNAKHHILLLGGTGICGLIFTEAALRARHTLTLYVRTPFKIPPELSSNSNLNVIQGEFDDEEAMKKASGCGADIFISLAGPTLGKREGTVRIAECCNGNC
jgi:NAD dependent epimerase/dehydratase family enzyme